MIQRSLVKGVGFAYFAKEFFSHQAKKNPDGQAVPISLCLQAADNGLKYIVLLGQGFRHWTRPTTSTSVCA